MKCENTMSVMAVLIDGEEFEFSKEQATNHLAECENCRREIEQMQSTTDFFKGLQRRKQSADLWFEIEQRLEVQTLNQPQKAKWQPFVMLVAGLIVYKLLEMLPEREIGLWLKLVPLVFVVALFGFIKENPFKINTKLALER